MDRIVMITLFIFSFDLFFVHFRLEQPKRLIEQTKAVNKHFAFVFKNNSRESKNIALRCMIASKVIELWIVNCESLFTPNEYR